VPVPNFSLLSFLPSFYVITENKGGQAGIWSLEKGREGDIHNE
jgi:hypothetical protein